jgi:hypothetical protein
VSTEPRTVTLPTEDHGDVTLPEPAWCQGHESTPGDLRADILHQGPGGGLGVSVSLLGQTLDPVALYDFAATLDSYADQLRDLSDQLHALLAGEDQ